MSLSKELAKIVNKHVDNLLDIISEKYHLSKDELNEIWETCSKTKTKKNKKLSPWHQFCKVERQKMKKENPHLSFGELSKLIGQKWMSMSDEDKKNYTTPQIEKTQIDTTQIEKTQIDTTQIEATQIDTTQIENIEEEGGEENDKYVLNKIDEEDIKEMKIKDLKTLCVKINLSKTGKRSELIDRLLKCKETLNKQFEDDMSEHMMTDDENNSCYEEED